MWEAIQFETIIDSGIIRIPEQYIKEVPLTVKVTLVPVDNPRIQIGDKSISDTLSLDDFPSLIVNVASWKFNRDEANER